MKGWIDQMKNGTFADTHIVLSVLQSVYSASVLQKSGFGMCEQGRVGTIVKVSQRGVLLHATLYLRHVHIFSLAKTYFGVHNLRWRE